MEDIIIIIYGLLFLLGSYKIKEERVCKMFKIRLNTSGELWKMDAAKS